MSRICERCGKIFEEQILKSGRKSNSKFCPDCQKEIEKQQWFGCCSVCGKEFKFEKTKDNKPKRRSTCPECEEKSKVKNRTITRICSKCGKEFTVKPYFDGKRYKYSLTMFCDDCRHSENYGKTEGVCPNCGKTFQYNKDKNGRITARKYCSEACAQEYYYKHKVTNEKPPKYNVCKRCGKIFQVNITPSGMYSVSSYCNECLEELKIERKTRVCKNCGKTFVMRENKDNKDNLSHSIFCSSECEQQYYKGKKERFPRYRTCETCGKVFEEEWLEDKGRYSESKYCSDVCYKIGYTRKREQTMLKKYGVIHHLKLQEFKDKQKATCLKKYGVPYAIYTPQCLEKNTTNNSKINSDFAKILELNNINFTTEFGLGNYIYDFKIGNILIEVNPNHTHSVLPSHWEKAKIRGKTPDYHLNKTNNAINSGYRCIHIWQWDDWDKVVLMLRDKQKLYARKLQLKEITKQEANVLLDTFHYLFFPDKDFLSTIVYGKPTVFNHQFFIICTFSVYLWRIKF